jgi:hypothetical protein
LKITDFMKSEAGTHPPQRTSGLPDLALEVSSGGHQLRRGERGQVTPGQFGFDAAKLFAESIDSVGGGAMNLT